MRQCDCYRRGGRCSAKICAAAWVARKTVASNQTIPATSSRMVATTRTIGFVVSATRNEMRPKPKTPISVAATVAAATRIEAAVFYGLSADPTNRRKPGLSLRD